MATDERELTDPVDLCGSDGRLNPAAVGWSRRTVHRANLRGGLGRWGRTKRWDYWAVLAGDLVISAVYADVDYLGTADVYWVDLETGRHGGASIATPAGAGLSLPERPGTAPLRVAKGPLHLEIGADGPHGTRLAAHWAEADGRFASFDLTVSHPAGHESLNVVIPWSDRTFQFTSKHQARPVRGQLVLGDEVHEIGADDDAWGVLDVGRGRWPYRTRWNWAGGAGRASGGAVVGLQFGGTWTEGTGATENGVLIDGRLTKIGQELRWEYRWDQPTRPWRVVSPDGALDATLTPRYDKHSKIEALVLGTETHQVFGRWSGSFTDDAGTTVAFDDIQGFAEESRSRW